MSLELLESNTNILEYLENKWKFLNGTQDPKSNSLTHDWWRRLSQLYSAPGRFYHTLKHIHQMLLFFEEFRDFVKNPQTVQFAIWFHDAIYDPTAKDNEERSAQLFKEFALCSDLSQKQIEKVVHYIMCTKNHQEAQINNDTDLELFLDFDLGILSVSEQDYDTYVKQIRQEYIHVNEDVFLKGRAQILTKLLNNGNIYRNCDFKKRYEPKAVQNIQRELVSLSQYVK